METLPTSPPIQEEDHRDSVERPTNSETLDMETKNATTETGYPKEVESMGIEELRAALYASNRERDEALRRESEMLLKNTQSDNDSSPNAPICYFFAKLPREVRDPIYEYLLVNPDLSSTKFVKGWGNRNDTDGTNKYNLSPQILRVCRQALEEGSKILYGSNKFIIEFVTMNDRPFLPENSPILRHALGKVTHPASYPKSRLSEHFPWVKKVQRWKVILTTNQLERLSAPDLSFMNFCRFLSSSEIQSLEVLLLPRGEMVTRRQLLRLDQVRGQDLPIYDPSLDANSLVYYDIPWQFVSALKTTLEGDSPVDHVFKMYKKLVRYAVAFERNSRFKEAMRPNMGERLPRISDPAAIRARLAAMRGNPYKQHPPHPVEGGLLVAALASDRNDVEAFKRARATVLEYLEPQYKRITSASTTMNELVKSIKQQARVFSIETRSEHLWDPELVTQCILPLEDYAKTFIRDAPYSIRLEIRRQQRKFDLIYASMKREMLMKKLSEALEIDQAMTHSLPWKTWFIAAVNDMDKQYLEIRRARKELFDGDRVDDQNHGCAIDLEPWRCDEMVDWTVDEPQFKPYALPTDDEIREHEESRRVAFMAERALAAQNSPPADPTSCTCTLVCVC